ncbi:hypothetical protein GCM10020331_081160 [Ectobacillus funiculus]
MEEKYEKKKLIQHEIGEQVDMYLLIKSAARGIASNGKPFLTLMLQDQSGEIEAKLWDVSKEDEGHYTAEKGCKGCW